MIDYLDRCIKEGVRGFCKKHDIYSVMAREELERRVCEQMVGSAVSWVMADTGFVEKLKRITDE